MYVCMYVCMFVCVSLSLSVYIYIYMHISSFKWQEPSPQEIKKRDVVTDTHVFLFPHIPEQWFLLLYCISQRKGAIRQKTRDRG